MLRRKRGADYDLSDSDDDDEARRRMKQKEFAKMRKALLADERIGKIAENPKRQAFLRSIEDRNSDDEMDFDEPLTQMEDETQASGPQDQQSVEGAEQSTLESVADSTRGSLKRKASDEESAPVSRLPPHLRRTTMEKRPASLAEIRDSLSFLIEEPNSLASHAGADESDDELDIDNASSATTEAPASRDANKENRQPFQARRSSASMAVIDRISLKRNSSLGTTTSTTTSTTRLAFASDTISSAPLFRVPALLRRATTNSGLSASISHTERLAGGAEAKTLKRTASKSSGVNYFARESERQKQLLVGEQRREQRIVKGATRRRNVVGDLLGRGSFD